MCEAISGQGWGSVVRTGAVASNATAPVANVKYLAHHRTTNHCQSHIVVVTITVVVLFAATGATVELPQENSVVVLVTVTSGIVELGTDGIPPPAGGTNLSVSIVQNENVTGSPLGFVTST